MRSFFGVGLIALIPLLVCCASNLESGTSPPADAQIFSGADCAFE